MRARFGQYSATMKQACLVVTGVILTSGILWGLGPQGPQGRGGGPSPSPASQQPPQTVTPQTYPADQVRIGEARFAAQCALCHGRDAAGAEIGPDLTRSRLVAEDNRGDKIAALIRNGRPEKGMPAIDVNAADTNAIIAYIHSQKTKMEALGGGRRSVEVAQLQVGNAEAGRTYFSGAGNCSKCHSATGDLAGLATRFQGLALMQRMLNPSSGRPAPKPAGVTVTLPSGEVVKGSLVSRDEFTLVITDAAGMRRTWATNEVKFTAEDPLLAHFNQLSKYTDKDMHDVFAYLQTLR